MSVADAKKKLAEAGDGQSWNRVKTTDSSLGFTGVLSLLCCLMLNGVTHAQGSMLDPVSTQVAAGDTHSCALMANGQVKCWGDNYAGQLGDGSTGVASLSPVTVKDLSNVVSISAASTFTCALATSGKVWCWGGNGSGQLGDGTTTDHPTPVVVNGLDNVAAIAAGDFHTCALTSAGKVYCWGSNSAGQLGDGTKSGSPKPVAVADLTEKVISISGGSQHTCAVTASGAARCWGSNQYGQLGDGATGTYSAKPVQVRGLTAGIASVSAGQAHTCALGASGVVFCWGSNALGRLGDGTTTNSPTPVEVKDLSLVVSLDAGRGGHSCARQANGDTYCWGNNRVGQLGDNTFVEKHAPTKVGFRYAQVAVGFEHTCGLTASGSVHCWGSNYVGQVGDGTIVKKSSPVGVIGLSGQWFALAAGNFHTCALVLRDNGVVRCWGSNAFGQLGDGTASGHRVPAPVNGLPEEAIAITAGINHTCALTKTGEVWCWGRNDSGQLGNGTKTAYSSVPVLVSGLTDVVSVSAGLSHTCARTKAGGVWCWGRNAEGQLGDGTNMERLVPVAVSGLASGVASIAAGAYHTCSLTTAGAMGCWGYNASGQLGDGTFTSRPLPGSVRGLPHNVGAMVAGRLHTCAVTTASEMLCWGDNGNGQLGVGPTPNNPVPVQPINAPYVGLADGLWGSAASDDVWVEKYSQEGIWGWGSNGSGQLGLGDAKAGAAQVYPQFNNLLSGFAPGFTIAAGGFHTCVSNSDGAGLRCMGNNANGQLGDGTTKEQHTPISILLGQPITFVVPPSLVIGGAVTLTASVGTGLPVSFDTWTPSTCTVSGTTLKVIAAGLCGVRASQGGGGLTGGGSAAAAPQQLRLIQVLPGATTTTLASSLNPSPFGQSVTFTATVTGVAPTGSVTFNDGATVLCNAVALTGVGDTRTAICSSAALTVGTHPLTATYSGDAGNDPSTTSKALPQVVQAATSGVVLASSVNPSTAGQSVTFTATVTGAAPTGSVTFKDGVAVLCNAVVLTGTGNSRTAICASSALAAGTHSITAVYSGDASNSAATSAALSQVVQTTGLAATTTTLILLPNPAAVGQAVTASVTVSSKNAMLVPTSLTAAKTPTGTVTVSEGTTSCSAMLTAGAGTCTLVFTTPGVHTLTAIYGGDAVNAASSTTGAVTVTVQPSGSLAAAPVLDAKTMSLLLGLLTLVGLRRLTR